MKKPSHDVHDIISAAILFASFAFMFSIWDYLPIFVDWAYHTAIGVEILNRGFITDNMFQFAPAGRPLIYPPLMGYVYAAIFYFGVDALTAARILSLFFYPAFLFSWWFFMRRFGALASVLFLVALASSYNLFVWMAQPVPISLVFIAAPFAFLIAEKFLDRRYSSRDKIIILALLPALLYLHFAALYLVMLPLGIAAAWKKSKELLRLLLLSLLIFAPWAVLILLNLQHINFVFFQDSFYLSPVLLLFAAIFVLSREMPRLLKNNYSLLLFSLMSVVILAVVGFHPTRVFAYVTLPLAFFGSLFMASLMKKDKVAATFLILIFLASSLTEFSLVYDIGKIELEPRRNPMIKRILAPQELGLEGREEYLHLADWIKSNTQKDDIIVTYDLNEIPVVITSLTGRKTTWGMFAEIRPVSTLLAVNDFVKNNGTIEVERYNPKVEYRGEEITRFGSIIVLNITAL